MRDWKWILIFLLLLYAVASTMQCNEHRNASDNILPLIDSLRKQTDQATDSATYYKLKTSTLQLQKAEADSVIKKNARALAEQNKTSQAEIQRIKLESTDEAITALRRELQDSLHPFKLRIDDQSLVAFTEPQTKKFRLTLAELPACSLQVTGLENLLSSKDIALSARDAIIEAQGKTIAFQDTAITLTTTENDILRNDNKRKTRQIKQLKIYGVVLTAGVLVGIGYALSK